MSYYYRRWRAGGTREAVNAAPRERYRARSGRPPAPSAAIIDSRPVKTTECGGLRGGACPRAGRRPDPGDGGEKVNGRERHLLVDTEGNLLKAKVHPADVHDRAGAELLLAGFAASFPTIRLPWADTPYRGLKNWLLTTLGWTLSITKHCWTGLRGVWLAPGQEPPAIPAGCHVLPRRWVAERTPAWIGRNRGMSEDDERLVETGGMLLDISTSRILLRRLAAAA